MQKMFKALNNGGCLLDGWMISDDKWCSVVLAAFCAFETATLVYVSVKLLVSAYIARCSGL